MARLTLALLGPFQVTLDGQTITGFAYEKVKALLAYLATEAGQPHHRDTLANMLWQDQTEQRARSNLRKALASLRQVLGDRDTANPFLLTTRNTIGFNASSDYTLDVAMFTNHLNASAIHQHLVGELCPDCVCQLSQAIALYQGKFLAQLNLSDSEVFKEWAMLTRERLHQQAIDACNSLSAYFEHQQNWDQAQQCAQRQLELEPWNEFAHQCLIRVLAQKGQRHAALKQFERCRRLLAEQLEVEPDSVTIALYEQLRTSSLNATSGQSNKLPDCLISDSSPPLNPEYVDEVLSTNSPTVNDASILNTQNALNQNELLSKLTQRQTPQSFRNRCKMIQKVYAFWIEGVLENSLHNTVLMNLGLKECPEAIAPPWHLVVQSPGSLQRTLPLESKIIDVYDKLPGALLILGAPGAGKTTLLLDLARLLLQRAEQDCNQPIPVVFNLSSWAIGPCSLDQWLVEELHIRYQVPRQIGQAWIAESQVLPLLDGLDEVAIEQRNACVSAINKFQAEYWLLDIVVCSRTDDYYALTKRLQFQAAIEIQPPLPEQIDSYLACLGDQLAGVRMVLQQDSSWREIADTPLMLNIIALCQEQIIDIQPPLSLERWRSHLFTTYTQKMLARQGADPRYSSQQMIVWLVWLARALTQQDQTLFLIEHLQPSWLSSDLQRRFVAITETVAVALIVGLVGGVGVGIHQGLAIREINEVGVLLVRGLWGIGHGLAVGFVAAVIAAVLVSIIALIPKTFTPHNQQGHSMYATRLGLAAGLGQGLAVGLTLGPMLGLCDAIVTGLGVGIAAWNFLKPGRITLVEVWSWSWLRVWLGVVPGATLGLAFGVVYGFANGFIYGVIIGPAVWLIAMIGFGLSGNEIEEKIAPNQGIRRSAISACSMAIAMGLPFGLANGVGYGLTAGIAGGIGNGISAGMVGSITFWLACGGLACIQHAVVRLFLCRDGAMPWNYARFLDYATERVFLRKVGGGYIFIHRLLLDYFATLDESVFTGAGTVIDAIQNDDLVINPVWR